MSVAYDLTYFIEVFDIRVMARPLRARPPVRAPTAGVKARPLKARMPVLGPMAGKGPALA